jgi:membrane protease YdiL (CAAX protease family)
MNQANAMDLTQETNTTSHQRIFLLVLLGLLILRIPFVGFMKLFEVQWEWIPIIFDIGTYLLTTFLIWWEVDHLADYHIDTLVVLIVVLFKPIQTLILKLWGFNDHLLTFPSLPSLLIWLIAIVFALGMWSKRSRLTAVRSVSIRWLLTGMLVGLLTAVVLSFPMSLQIPKAELTSEPSIGAATLTVLAQVLLAFPYQIGYAAVTEEPLFRGFLWGYLRKLQWREVWIWLFQAGLFTFAHIYYIIKHPISFWIIVPVGALVLGFLAWRSRTIAASMAVHGMMNATGYGFGYLVALLRIG